MAGFTTVPTWPLMMRARVWIVAPGRRYAGRLLSSQAEVAEPHATEPLTSIRIPTASTKVVLADTVDIAPVAVGCWSWGDRPTWKWTPESEADDMDAFRTAIRSGINLFDTAEKYGNGESERLLGRFIARDKVRDKVAIATKFLPLPGKTNYSEVLLDALKNSLQRLGVDFVELYQVHGPIHQVSLNTIADALAEAVRQGWTKTVGVSNYSVEEMMTVYERLRDEHGIQLATNQVEFSLTRTLPLENGMVDACRDAGIVLLAYSPLGMGRLTGKYSASNPPPSGRRFSDYKMEELEPLLDTMRRIAQHHAVPVPAVALNWVMSKGAVPVAGAKNGLQAAQNAMCLGWRLTDDDVAALNAHSIVGTTDPSWQHG
ncbi:NADP-dependent oxidoreductase domain-containing protein [Plasmodiophora brassicae]|uniref:NADP-dependent oxidoreductase domain-containing protein n=1 Tax=Plasmodiophora brassicae TaxID=37360 RepID=A0A0G4INM4_PLABS|nr:hypothetical protein PBRA_005388 [Plasmodiophora brassicae]SPR00678.1 unnamed protein product [Plasmodiophora brassicae]